MLDEMLYMLTAFIEISILVSATHPPFYQMKLYTVAVYDLRKCTNMWILWMNIHVLAV